MNNADMPAMPQTEESYNAAGEYILEVRGGLTKREHFAAMAMQGVLSGVNGDADLHNSAEEWKEDVASASVEFADALLAELERTKS